MEGREADAASSSCGCLRRLFRRAPRAPHGDRPEAASSSSTASGALGKEAPGGSPAGPTPAAPAATLKPQATGRRSRSDSPRAEGGPGEEQPVKRQNSMGLDDPASVAPKSGAQPMEEGGVPASPSAASSQATQQLPARQGQQQQQQQSAQSAPPPAGRQTAAPASPRLPAVANACPPFGSKSVIGRRAKMEDACVAVPYLVEVPVSRAGMDELLPPRIAPQLRTLSAGSGASEQTAAAAAAARAEVYAAGSALGSGSQEQQQQRQQASSGGGVFAMAVDPADTTSGALSGGPATETLHFFGVFDGHGGADAALHCARSLHERVRDVLSACSHPAADLLTLRSSKDAAAPQASSSGGTGEQPRQQGASSSEDYRDATAAAAADSSSSAGSYLDADFDEAAAAEASNSVQGVQCTTETIEAALTKAFHITDEEFGNMGGYEHLALVGTTAVVALIGSRMIYVANCGDSRAVLCRDGGALALTDDHKAAREDETARVEAAGGQILFWNGVRVMGLLAVSRAIGDHSLRPYVIAEPEVTIVARHPSDEVLVMASDGLWDVMSNQEAVTLAKKCLGRARSRGSTRQSAARVAATVLTRAAVDRGSRDNVTVVIVDLSPMTPEEMEAEARLTERTETVPDPAPAQGQQQQQQSAGAPYAQASGTALRSSSDKLPVGSAVPIAPPVQISPFAGQAGATVSPFADPALAVPAQQAEAACGAATSSSSAAGAAPLVSPFSSGALPAGLDFDQQAVRKHANALAAAAAAAGGRQPGSQQQERGS